MTSAAVAATQAGATPEVDVPDRPRLVDGVHLHGEMKESAYKDPPFLVERDGAYFPVSRLLHAVLEQADGQSSLAADREHAHAHVQPSPDRRGQPQPPGPVLAADRARCDGARGRGASLDV